MAKKTNEDGKITVDLGKIADLAKARTDDAAKERLHHLEKSHVEAVAKINKSMDDSVVAGEKALENSRSLYAQAIRGLSTARDETSAAKDEFDAATKDFKAATEAHHKQLALKAATEYWGAEIGFHNTEAGTWRTLSLRVLVIGIVILVGAHFSNHLIFGEKIKGFADYWMLGGTLLLTIIFLWLIKICVRNYLGHRHQAQVSSQRKVMITTYLALSQDAKVKLPDTAIEKLLDAVFAEIDTGMTTGTSEPPIVQNIGKLKG